MTKLVEILTESFEMLFERPVLFVPRLFSTVISSLLIIGWFSNTVTTLHFLIAFPLIAIIGAFTPVMVSSMVEKDEEEDLLRRGFKESLGLWKQVLGLTGLTVFLAFLNSLPLSIGLMATFATGNIAFVIIGGLISLLILLAISFGLYFVPISLIKDRTLFEGMQNAFNTSNQNKKEVVTLTLFSLGVLLASSTVTGELRDIGFTVFFLGRIVSAVVGTYLLVISPQFYLSQEVEE